jgi:peptidoglycan/LPS O-acetylase OafA/YrhL
MVLLMHATYVQNFFNSPLIAGLFNKGGFGVQIFFVISGFIITHILLREEAEKGRISLKGFYFRRALRILPPAYFYLLAIGILAMAGYFKVGKGEFVAGLFFFRNLFLGDSVFVTHFWTLAIEEQFYLLWPLLVIITPPAWRLSASFSLAAFIPLWRQVNIMLFGENDLMMSRTDFCCDTLLVGAVLAFALNAPRWRPLLGRVANHSGLTFSASLIVVIICVFLARQLPHFGPRSMVLSVACWGVGGIVFTLISGRSSVLNSVFNWKPLVWIGKISFSLYLWQQLVTFNPLAKGWQGVLISTGLSLVLAALSYYLVERSSQHLRSRLEAKAIMKHSPSSRTGEGSNITAHELGYLGQRH